MSRRPLRLLWAVCAVLAVLNPATAHAQEAPAPARTDPTPAPAPAPADPTPAPTPAPTPPPDGAPEAVCSPPSPDGDDDEAAPDEPPPPALALVGGRCIPTAELSRLLAGYEASVAEEASALLELRDAIDHLDELTLQLEIVERQLGEVKVRLSAAEAETRYAAIREQVAQDELAAVEAELERQRGILRDQAVAAYIGGGDLSKTVSDAMLTAENLNDVGSTRAYGQVVVEHQVDQVALVTTLEEAAVELAGELEAAKVQADALAEDLDDTERLANSLRDAQQGLVDDATVATEEQAALVASIQARRDEFAGQLGLSSASGGAIASVLAGLSDGSGSLADVGTLASPISATSLASAFGPRLHPIFNEVRIHTGIDLNGAAGTPLLASAAGVVVIASAQGGYGNVTVIDHGGGIATLYAHQSAFAVPVGTEVETGQIIGYVGSTGFSTGPHLHFELRIDGLPVDPLPFVDLRMQAEGSS